MTQEDNNYKEKYKRALEVMREWVAPCHTKEQLDVLKKTVFSELAESEDERIRRELIEFINHYRHNTDLTSEQAEWCKKVLSYLEKQKVEEKHNRMAPIYSDKESFESALEKAWKFYNESAARTVDSFEDDYIECVFSKGFREGFLYREKQKEQKPSMIQWKGDNLKEVIDFTGKSPMFNKWFKSFEEYEEYVHSHGNIFKLFNEDGAHYEVPVGAWIVKTPDGCNVASKAVFRQKPAELEQLAKLREMTHEIREAYERGIEVGRAELKQVWSEEDEKIRQSLLRDYEYAMQSSGTVWGKNFEKKHNWLKALHYSWKPSEVCYGAKGDPDPAGVWKPSGEKKYDGNMDKECIKLCDILNSIPSIDTFESCCGHLKNRYSIWFFCNDIITISRLGRCVERNYSDGKWELLVDSTDTHPTGVFWLRSKVPFQSYDEMEKSVNNLCNCIQHWFNTEFDSYFNGNTCK